MNKMKNTLLLKISFLFPLFICIACDAQQREDKKMTQRREEMVEKQIKARGIDSEKVISAMLEVKRHLFVPKNYREYAYADRPLPIGEGQTISQPYIVAFMTEALNLDKEDKVLEVGTGSGYQAAVLAKIVDQVYSIEINHTLGERSEQLLSRLGYDNVKVKIGDGYKGWDKYAPFDAIIVTCSPSHVPKPLKQQLAEGGKMVIPVGKSYNQELVLLTKKNNELKQESIIPVRFVPMIKGDGEKY